MFPSCNWNCKPIVADPKVRVCLLAWCVLTVGCAQPNGAPAQSAPYPAQSYSSANNISELYRRAQEQEKLANMQQAELDRLQTVQRQYDDLLAGLKRREYEEYLSQQKLLAQRQASATNRAQAVEGQFQELTGRARRLDSDNRDLQARIARSQKEYQILKDQNNLLRQRLKETVDQLATTYDSAQESQQRVKALQASARRRGGAQITANNSLRRSLTAVSVDGLEIRQSGELVRILLPSDQLFKSGTANLIPGAENLIDQVSNVVSEHYPNQVIGVEAHADNNSIAGSLWRNRHQLTAAQAMSVFEQLSYKNRFLQQQLFVLGHGANYPIVSNGTPAGQARNRRLEIVIYPETVANKR